ncbi:MAG: hypothetical protein LBV60_13560 [Streptomyces sp.]|jgi:hypothetical protein|nr:hypothetical protein [Streptomyces sp.]
MQAAVQTALISVGTSLVTAYATGAWLTPRLEARKRRITEVHAVRDRFLASMLKVMAVSARLRNTPAPDPEDPAWTPTMRERVEGERIRWQGQLGETTEWMVDNLETYALSWPSTLLRKMVFEYAAHARAVMLSERADDRKAVLLQELTEPVWEVFGARVWQRGPFRLRRAVRGFAAKLEEIAAEADRQAPAPVTAG